MRILISNDDGYKADGIIQLAKSLNDIAEVIVVAPSENKSAASSSLTIGKPLKPVQIEKNIFAIEFISKRLLSRILQLNQFLFFFSEHPYQIVCKHLHSIY